MNMRESLMNKFNIYFDYQDMLGLEKCCHISSVNCCFKGSYLRFHFSIKCFHSRKSKDNTMKL